MANINVNNFSVTRGRLASDPRFFENSDGSRTVRFTVMAPQNYTRRDGSRGSDVVSVERFIPADHGNGVFDMIHRGDKVTVTHHATTDVYTDESGVTHYVPKNIVDDVNFEESQAVTSKRLAKRVAEQNAANRAAQLAAPAAPVQAAPAQPQAPVYDDMQSPFVGIADQDNPPF